MCSTAMRYTRTCGFQQLFSAGFDTHRLPYAYLLRGWTGDDYPESTRHNGGFRVCASRLYNLQGHELR